MQKFIYKGMVLKTSGEVLGGGNNELCSNESVCHVCQQIRTLVMAKVEVGLIIGCGNNWRGAKQGGKIG